MWHLDLCSVASAQLVSIRADSLQVLCLLKVFVLTRCRALVQSIKEPQLGNWTVINARQSTVAQPPATAQRQRLGPRASSVTAQ